MDTITSSGYKADPGEKIGSSGRQVITLLPRNPLDKATIVSVYPRPIVDEKPTLFPSRYVIPAAKPPNEFSLLIIGGASYFIPSQIERQPPTEVQVNAMALAESIINDSIPSMNLVSGTSRPGIFVIPGEWTPKTIISYTHADGRSFKDLIDVAKGWQQSYWKDIIDEADYFWAASNGNPRTIPEDARLAAKILGMEKVKPWMSNVVASELVSCKACGENVNPAFPICRNCKNPIAGIK